KNLIIRGPGADVFAISSGSKDYDIRLLSKFLVSISGISFKNSTHTNHGFLFNEGNLTLIECIISGNTVTGRNGGSAGITNEGGILKLIGSSIIDNKVTNMSIIGAGGVLN